MARIKLGPGEKAEGPPRDDSALEARDGDELVVSYPEVAVPIAQYFTVRVGGLTYSRQLRDGDDAAAEYDKIYAFLQGRAERDAAAKIRAWAEEHAKARGK